ncbi:Proto-chlorophyllide reductase 57 kD subunit [Chloroherpeton thalassium ATCC 35110]|uniref:Proto-chlorophyllide reductase 57 kD subunit n=1 Tax=Chloroherpeton thalassium (strain ATCC 35110 / GB-78) TaxID=517418 RepID=B3QTF2_CHLT3|nr:flavodoxin domain-containing protein [Chloroherpeton thalassium]ACF12698.1 Proto-chlorophyllide reductase 57 kD subunit [Chloroherpeton thalassium ATCC 35110]
MNAIILFDSHSSGGATDRIIDTIGQELAKRDIYVEKGKVLPNADYSFLDEFDLILLGSPIYNLRLSENLAGAIIQSNLLAKLDGKQIALFVICGGPELSADLLYLPQLQIPLLNKNIIAKKAFGMSCKNDPESAVSFAEEIYEKAAK